MQVLTRSDPAQLLRSDEIRGIQGGAAIDSSILSIVSFQDSDYTYFILSHFIVHISESFSILSLSCIEGHFFRSVF
jgi:hypothetical protein